MSTAAKQAGLSYPPYNNQIDLPNMNFDEVRLSYNNRKPPKTND